MHEEEPTPEQEAIVEKFLNSFMFQMDSSDKSIKQLFYKYRENHAMKHLYSQLCSMLINFRQGLLDMKKEEKIIEEQMVEYEENLTPRSNSEVSQHESEIEEADDNISNDDDNQVEEVTQDREEIQVEDLIQSDEEENNFRQVDPAIEQQEISVIVSQTTLSPSIIVCKNNYDALLDEIVRVFKKCERHEVEKKIRVKGRKKKEQHITRANFHILVTERAEIDIY